jgi:hypothetical protein
MSLVLAVMADHWVPRSNASEALRRGDGAGLGCLRRRGRLYHCDARAGVVRLYDVGKQPERLGSYWRQAAPQRSDASALENGKIGALGPAPTSSLNSINSNSSEKSSSSASWWSPRLTGQSGSAESNSPELMVSSIADILATRAFTPKATGDPAVRNDMIAEVMSTPICRS